ncbi:hypothetical protein B0T20DRAFT_495887 [Sordaria brevicollis]|uniref:Hsp70 family protein n=1 Tax=Sordaria brevicollis TaxID=83679 RepID=A0AAE0PH99_SORBR|nr:hypothetical protein B0T20DRAFT_495887 [Sordaria brevicollis]
MESLSNALGEKVCIGIDFGSTGIRGYALSNGKIGKCFPNTNASLMGLDGMSFPTHGYIYDDNGPIYLPHKLAVNRDPEALKYGFYLLSGDPYPLMKRLRNAFNNQLKVKLETGITQVLQNLRAEILQNDAFKAHGWRIGDLSVTVPNQWTLEFEEVYTKLLARAFNWGLDEAKNRIFYITETDALAHFLLTSEEYVLVAKLLRGQDQQRAVLVLDFGGHNTNGAIFWVQSKKNQEPKFFMHGDAFTIGCGGQHLYYNLLQACENKYRAKLGMPPGNWLPAAAREQIRQKWLLECRHIWGPGDYLSGPYAFHIFDDSFNHVPLIFEKKEIDAIWYDTYHAGLDVIEEALQNLKRMTSKPQGGCMPISLVTQAGGSMGNKPLNGQVQGLVEKWRVDENAVVNKMGLDDDTVRLAKGGPRAVVDMITIQSFFQQGAAIGLQLKQHRSDEWDDSSAAVFYFCTRTESYRGWFDCELDGIKAGDEFRLVCDPWYADKNPNMRNRDPDTLPRLSAERGYVLLEGQPSVLPRPEHDGKCFIKADVKRNGNTMELILNMALVAKPNRARYNRYKLVERRLPLYYDGGNKVVHLGARDKPLEEMIRTGADGPRAPTNPADFLNSIGDSP